MHHPSDKHADEKSVCGKAVVVIIKFQKLHTSLLWMKRTLVRASRRRARGFAKRRETCVVPVTDVMMPTRPLYSGWFTRLCTSTCTPTKKPCYHKLSVLDLPTWGTHTVIPRNSHTAALWNSHAAKSHGTHELIHKKHRGGRRCWLAIFDHKIVVLDRLHIRRRCTIPLSTESMPVCRQLQCIHLTWTYKSLQSQKKQMKIQAQKTTRSLHLHRLQVSHTVISLPCWKNCDIELK